MAKDAYYFSHDSNARHDPKITAMRGVYGSEGYGWYWMLIEMMRDANGYALDMHSKYAFNAYAMQLHTTADRIASFINDCIHEFELFASDGEYFWSESLLKRMELRDERSEKAKKAAEARWGKTRKNAKDDANASKNTSEGNANAVDNDALKERKEKESKGKEIKENNYYSESLSFFTSQFVLIPSPFLIEQLNQLIDEYSDVWVLKALQTALMANKKDLRYVAGILTKWRDIGDNEPWNHDKKPQSKPGKPQIPTVAATESDPISEEELAELRKLAKKFDDEGG